MLKKRIIPSSVISKYSIEFLKAGTALKPHTEEFAHVTTPRGELPILGLHDIICVIAKDGHGQFFEVIPIDDASPEPFLTQSITKLNLPGRAYNCLKKKRVSTIGQLLQMSRDDLRAIKGCGPLSRSHILQALRVRGLHLKNT